MEEDNKLYDSIGELHFSYWTDELIKAEYIKKAILQPEAYSLSERVTRSYIKQMKTKDKVVEQTVLREHIYTPDVLNIWTDKAYGIFIPNDTEKIMPHHLSYNIIKHENVIVAASIVELKPPFDQNNMTRLATINIKWVYDKYSVVVDMVKLPKFFEKTFTPDRFLLTDKSMKPRKIKYAPRSLTQFINSLPK